jgi:hypothetical protein
MKKIVRLTESDLARIVRRVVNEGVMQNVRDIMKDGESKTIQSGDTKYTFTREGENIFLTSAEMAGVKYFRQ